MLKPALAFTFTAAVLSAQSPVNDLFENKIRPVLVQSCYPCHSSTSKSPMGGLALDTKAGLLTGGNSGASITSGNPDQSLLVRALRYNDIPKMPPSGKLPDQVIKDFEQWISAGAPDPRTEQPAPGASTGGPRVIDFAKGRKWWAFQPVKELRAPVSKDKAFAQKWQQSKIDAFILSKLENAKLKPSPEADSRTLVSRVYVDLVGYIAVA